jgi:hypothetical protein
MGIMKSFGISFLIYIVLNFLMNMLIVVAETVPDLMDWFMLITTDTYGFLSNLFVVQNLGPSGMAIPEGLYSGLSELKGGGNIFLGIMMIFAPILPGLISAIVAGKMAENSKQAFGGWMLTALISAVVLLVFAFINPALHSPGQILEYIGSLAVSIPEPWGIVVYTLIIGLFSGLFWSGLAAISGAED